MEETFVIMRDDGHLLPHKSFGLPRRFVLIAVKAKDLAEATEHALSECESGLSLGSVSLRVASRQLPQDKKAGEYILEMQKAYGGGFYGNHKPQPSDNYAGLVFADKERDTARRLIADQKCYID